MKAIGMLVTGFFVAFIVSIIGGFVFMKLWGWLIMPVFPVPSLSLIQSMGVSYFISYLKLNWKKEEEKEEDFWITLLSTTIRVVITCTFILLFGWIIHLLY